MAIQRRLKLAFVLGCVLLCSLAVPCATGFAVDQGDRGTAAFSAGARHLQQNLAPCPVNFDLDNFTALELACPYASNISDNYPRQQCCSELAVYLCPYSSLVNDPNSACAGNFFAAVTSAAPSYNNNFFGFICTNPDDPLGIPCPGNSTNSTNSSPSTGPYSFLFSFLIAVAVLEILILVF